MARVAAEGVRWPGTRAQSAESGLAGRAVHLLEGSSGGRPHLDAVHDGVAEDLRQEPGRALVGCGHIGWFGPNAADLELVLPQRRVDGEDLATLDPAHGATLGDVPAHRRQRDLPLQVRADERVGQVLAGRPHRGATRGRLERDQRGPEPAPAEQEVPGRRQLRHDRHAPVQVVAVGLHAEEGPCIHGAAPYRDA